MISGIVYFDEILEGIKAATGIENLSPYYEKLRTAVLDAEYDIAPGGSIVRKRKTYANGDGYYDGTYMTLPYDFRGEYSFDKLNTAYYRGNVLELHETPGPDEVILDYMGLLLDAKGDPVSTRNHKDAVIKAGVILLYAPRVFLGKGDKVLFAEYKREYNDLVMASRGNDAFGTEADWDELGVILQSNSGDYLIGNCGLPYAPKDTGIESGTPPISGSDCGTLTVDMVAVFEANLT